MDNLQLQLQTLVNQVLACVSPTTQAPFETQMVDVVQPVLTAAGFTIWSEVVKTETLAEHTYQRCNILAEKGTGPTSILIFAHLDTNPSVENMLAPEGEYSQYDEHIYAPGILRGKGGLIALLNALHGLNPIDTKIKIALLVDGEGTQAGARALAKSDWLEDVQLALTPQPVYEREISHQPHQIRARTDNEFMEINPSRELILMIEDYLKDYLDVSTIWHYPKDTTPESNILTNHNHSFPIIALGPQGQLNAHEEWVNLDSIQDISNILKFVLNYLMV